MLEFILVVLVTCYSRRIGVEILNRFQDKKLKGSVTIEAAFLMPILLFIQLLCMYTSFYIYNSVVISQCGYLALLRVVNTGIDDNEEMAENIELELAQFFEHQLIAVDELEWDIEVSLLTVTLEIRADMLFPFGNLMNSVLEGDTFQIHVTETMERSRAQDFIRLWKGMGL
jgi:hypothetical protein